MTVALDEQKTEDELWLEFKKTKSSQLRDKFIRQYMPLVKYVAGKVSVGMPGSVDFDDFVFLNSSQSSSSVFCSSSAIVIISHQITHLYLISCE